MVDLRSAGAQLAKDGEVDLMGTWSNRMQSVIDDGAKATYVYDGGILIADCFFIPKGSKKRDLAMKAIGVANSPEFHANIAKYIPISPVSADAVQFIAPDRVKLLPRIARKPQETGLDQRRLVGRQWGGRSRALEQFHPAVGLGPATAETDAFAVRPFPWDPIWLHLLHCEMPLMARRVIQLICRAWG